MCWPSAVPPLLLLILTICSCIHDAATDTARAEPLCVCFKCLLPFKPMFFFSILKSGLRQKCSPEHCYMCIKDPITFLWVLFNYQDQVDYLTSVCTPLSFKSINLDPHLAKSRFSGMITSCDQLEIFLISCSTLYFDNGNLYYKT